MGAPLGGQVRPRGSAADDGTPAGQPGGGRERSASFGLSVAAGPAPGRGPATCDDDDFDELEDARPEDYVDRVGYRADFLGGQEFVFAQHRSAQRPIREIEQRAGLDFGPLADIDPLAGQEEAPLIYLEGPAQIRFVR